MQTIKFLSIERCHIMDIQISPFRECDIDTVFTIQQAAFKPLYEKYHDDSSNPYMETMRTLLHKYTRMGKA